MKLSPLLFLAAILLCVHLNEGRLVLRVSSILRSSSGGTNWADKLQKWMEARRQLAKENNALAETTGDEDAKDPAENEDELPQNVDVEDDVDDHEEDDMETRRRKWLVYARLRGSNSFSSRLLSALLKKAKTHAKILLEKIREKYGKEHMVEETTPRMTTEDEIP